MADEVQGTLANALRDALIAAHHETVDHAHDKATDARTATMETWEQELSATIREIGLLDMTDPSIPEPIRRLFAPVNKPQNQTDFFFSIMAALGLIFTGAAAASAGPAQTLQQRSLRNFGDVYPDPNQVAALAVRGIINEEQLNTWASQSGMRSERLQALTTAAWNHLPAGTVMDLMRRRKMTVDEGRAVMKLQGIPNLEIEQLILTLVGPLDFGTAVAAVTQNQITQGEFADLLPQYGIDAKWEKVIYESSGATMPPDMAMRLFREGGFTEKEFDDALTESNLKNKYVPFMKKLRFRYPPMEQTLRMLRHKIIEKPEAQDYLEKQGFRPDDARRLVDSAASASATTTKNLSPSVIEKLYEVGKWDRGQADGALQALGYDATESDLLLTLVDEHKAHQQTDRAATSIGTRYVSWKIDRAEVVTLLDRLSVPTANRDEMLEIWDARREAQTLHLSEAFLHKAFTKGNITAGEVETRLLAMGYDAIDTKIIMATDFAVAAPKAKTKDLSRADETKRYKAGIIDRATFHARLEAAGYDAGEADQIIELVDRDIEAAAEKAAAGNGA